MNEVETYITALPQEVQFIINKARKIIMAVDKQMIERLSYGIIGYYIDGKPLVYIGGFKKHIGLYATPQGHEAFQEKLSVYKQGKGSVQFPINKEIPYDLIREIAEFRNKQIKD